MRHNALLLQGPLGPFFARFARSLEAHGFTVCKVNFNGGDRLFYRDPNTVDFTGTPEDWPDWLERLIADRHIGRIYVFGDCRQYHRVAREIALRYGIGFYVFEEGYFRPNYVTLEPDGVNGYSTLLRDRDLTPSDGMLAHGTRREDEPAEHARPRHTFAFAASYAIAYYLACRWYRHRYPGYVHHRPLDLLSEAGRWILSGLRKLRYRLGQRRKLEALREQYYGNYFFCPLQVHCDMQVLVHSDFDSIEHFIGDVLSNFARHAPRNKAIVFKHHPMDRGYTHYRRLFDRLVNHLGLQGRVFYVHDLDLPSLLDGAEGTVLINSTVGLTSLACGRPVKTLGRSVYDRPGLTAQCALADFWSDPGGVDRRVFLDYRSHLIARTQIGGNLYRRIAPGEPAGLSWSPSQLAAHGTATEPAIAGFKPRLSIVSPAERVDDDRSAAA